MQRNLGHRHSHRLQLGEGQQYESEDNPLVDKIIKEIKALKEAVDSALLSRAAWGTALEGDSGDAEIAAGSSMAEDIDAIGEAFNAIKQAVTDWDGSI